MGKSNNKYMKYILSLTYVFLLPSLNTTSLPTNGCVIYCRELWPVKLATICNQSIRLKWVMANVTTGLVFVLACWFTWRYSVKGGRRSKITTTGWNSCHKSTITWSITGIRICTTTFPSSWGLCAVSWYITLWCIDILIKSDRQHKQTNTNT